MTADALLAQAVRGWLADFVDNTYLNAQEASADGYESTRWDQLRDLGWHAVTIPDHLGGGDATLTEACVVAREIGRAAYASPLLATMRATVVASGGAGYFDALVARIAAGAPATLVCPPDRTVTATPVAGGFRLAGEPVVVEWAEVATEVVLLVPAGGDWVVGVLGRDALDGRVSAVPSVDNERIARVALDGVVVREAVTVPAGAARLALAGANLLRASLMVGGCADVLERTARYATERVQFGRPIGGFQAVRHHLARMVIATDAARLMVDDALERLAEPAVAEVALFTAARSYVELVLTSAQVHGAVGTTTEHVLHHHFRRAKAMRSRTGTRALRLRELHDALVVHGEASQW